MRSCDYVSCHGSQIPAVCRYIAGNSCGEKNHGFVVSANLAVCWIHAVSTRLELFHCPCVSISLRPPLPQICSKAVNISTIAPDSHSPSWSSPIICPTLSGITLFHSPFSLSVLSCSLTLSMCVHICTQEAQLSSHAIYIIIIIIIIINTVFDELILSLHPVCPSNIVH